VVFLFLSITSAPPPLPLVENAPFLPPSPFFPPCRYRAGAVTSSTGTRLVSPFSLPPALKKRLFFFLISHRLLGDRHFLFSPPATSPLSPPLFFFFLEKQREPPLMYRATSVSFCCSRCRACFLSLLRRKHSRIPSYPLLPGSRTSYAHEVARSAAVSFSKAISRWFFPLPSSFGVRGRAVRQRPSLAGNFPSPCPGD